jgi:hypothetical protein
MFDYAKLCNLIETAKKKGDKVACLLAYLRI